ncbi:MAG TPA: hypothetical protein VKR56_11240 [Candidatus Cybelea sp.]|nr:hypothetical protein [Candidatus Cybelea sp.]
MIDIRLGRYALGVSVAVAMSVGCGHTGSGVVPIDGAPNSRPYHKSFYYTGAAQEFKVRAGVTQIEVIALGGKGAGSPVTRGGRVGAVLPVTPGEELVVYVGGDSSGATGGFNGGANAAAVGGGWGGVGGGPEC